MSSGDGGFGPGSGSTWGVGLGLGGGVGATGVVAKMAIALRDAFMATLHVRNAPAHAPDQWSRRLPAAGTAVSVTASKVRNGTTHESLQSTPWGSETILPSPVPRALTFSVVVGGGGPAAKIATMGPGMDATQVALSPWQTGPFQRTKKLPVAGVAA